MKKMRLALGMAGALAVAFVVTQAGGAASPRAASVYSAVVNVDGSLAHGHGAVSSSANGVDGQYEVVFGVNVSACAYVGGAGEATATGPDDGVTISTAPAADNVDAVFVQEYDTVLARDSYSSGFHLVVVC